MNSGNLKHTAITDKILKGFYEVYNELGHGFLESVYENALVIILTGYGLNIESQKDIPVYFREIVVGEFVPDLIVNDNVIVEIKAVENLVPAHEAQLINYLRATDVEVGIVLNFGKIPEFKRFAYDNKRKKIANIRSSQ